MERVKQDIFVFLEVMAGMIEGVVSDENGIPLVGAEVSGALKSGKPSETMKTDERGHYVFSGISSGSYYLRAKAAGHMIEGAQASIIGGGTALVNFVLKTGSLSITGEVLTQKDHKPADCQISLMRNGVVVTTTYTKASGDGEYTFENLVPDLYEIGVVSTGYSCKGWRGRIERNEVLDFQLETPSLETYSRCHDPNWEDSGLLG